MESLFEAAIPWRSRRATATLPEPILTSWPEGHQFVNAIEASPERRRLFGQEPAIPGNARATAAGDR